MGIAKHHYVPALKWRMGEYQALFRLSDAQKDAITPLIMIPPREYDFEELRMKKTIHEHIEPFAKRMLNKWGTRPAIIDIHDSLEEAIMNSGDRVYPYIFEKLRELECNAIPVINFRRGGLFSSDIIQLIATDSQGVALRISLEDLMTPSINSDISSKLYELQVNRSETDLIIDLQEPESFEPYTDFSAALASTIGDIDHLTQFRSFVITGMSLKLSNIKKPGNVTPRHEWNLYKQLAADLVDLRVPSYGDYTIETPQFAEQDMRKMKPAGKIVYTSEDSWFVTKGSAFRDNPAQMQDHCRIVVGSGHYCGANYSYGDKRIQDTLNGTTNTGNLSTWKQVGVNHHLAKVVDQLASFHASGTGP